MDPFSTAEDDGALRFLRRSADDLSQLEEMAKAGACFDTVLFLDVLEHLYDPWSVLAATKSLLRHDGRILVSVPNAQFVGVTVPLVVQGRFDYKTAGVMDRTHIRWFTRRTLLEMIDGAGFRVEEVQRHVEPRVAGINRATFGLFEQFFAYQYFVRACLG
jgi:2-polyprenyl-3-methyl-5-hydroxy-6-metoxy-1,4-benzoquinol methylase